MVFVFFCCVFGFVFTKHLFYYFVFLCYANNKLEKQKKEHWFMKLIHTADLHLDSPLTANLVGKERVARKTELLQTFQRLVDTAEAQNVQAILIAGDFFDATQTTQKTKQYVYDIITTHPNLEFYYLCGNHDENLTAFAGVELPENLFVFSDVVTTYKIGDYVTVTGVELNEDNYKTVYDNIALSQDLVNIVMLHGQVEGASNNYETLRLQKLKDLPISYLALGHYHKFQTGKLNNKADYCYAGCLEPRGFDEIGPKGYVLIDISEDNKLGYEFVPFSKRTIWEIEVNMTKLETVLNQEKAVDFATKHIAAKDWVRVVLVGDVALDTRLDLEHLQTVFADKFANFELKNKTQLKYDAEKLKANVSVEGEFVRTVLQSAESQEMQQQIIKTGLDVLYGKEV